ncbi:MAG: hypothetical protein HY277_03845, partial [Ignavibacteriales bacterium]|nr:hypothetical protein [Ignavibacteriales bacterium]
MEPTSTFYKEILRRLDGVRKKENRFALLYGALTTFLISVGLIIIIIFLEEVFSFGTLVRTFLFTTGALVIVGALVWYILRPLLYVVNILKSANASSLALKVGKQFPGIRDRLLDALQMYEARERLKQNYSLALIDASFTDLYEQIRPLDFTEAVSDYRVRRIRKFVLYTVGVSLLMFVISPSGFFSSFYRIVNYHQSFASPLPIQFSVEPGNVEVVRGQNVPIGIRASGNPIQNLSLMTRQHGQLEFDTQNLKATADGAFRTEISNIKASTEYFVTADEIKSDKYSITVLDRPLMRSLLVKVLAPAYTRIPPKVQDENIGDVSAYPGSSV